MNAIYSFLAGTISFFSPCILPLLPSYLIYIGNISLNESFMISYKKKKAIICHTVSFIFGFSFVFISFGIASSMLGRFLIHYRSYLIVIGGIIVVLFGLFTLGVINVPFLARQLSVELKQRPHGILGSFVVGLTFALGWSPCIGPALSSVLILTLNAENTVEAILLLFLYCLGLGIPFILSSLMVDKVVKHFVKIGAFAKYAKFTLGLLLIILGVFIILSLYLPVTQTLLKVLHVF